MRVAATREGDEAKATTAKLFGNSSYGKTCEDPSRRCNVLLKESVAEVRKYMKKPLYQDHVAILDENECPVGYEIKMKKRQIVDNQPVHIGNAILQQSKLLLNSFVYFLYEHLIPGSWHTVYADTDSIALALSNTGAFHDGMTGEEKYQAIYQNIIRPEMRASWESKYKSWFVTTNEPEDIRLPGKFKTEFEYTEGRFLGLMPKTYLGVNYADNSTKMGSKGLPHHLQLELDEFKEALYGQSSHNVTIHGLRLNPDKRMCKVKLKKRGLTCLFKKFSVASDGITCTPLTQNGNFL